MKLEKILKTILGLTFLLIIFNSCEKDECTKMVNIPQWDPNEMTFVDNFQEVPCDFEEPADEPVN